MVYAAGLKSVMIYRAESRSDARFNERERGEFKA